jgi:RNA polymerase sigma-70 factor (ECF subfamily)
MDSHSLIEKIKNKDGEKELKKVYSLYRNEFILWTVRNYSCTTEEAQDVFQQVVVIFYESIKIGRLTEITSTVKTYLFSIGKNKIQELLRKRKRSIATENADYYIDTNIFYGEEDDYSMQELDMVTNCLNELGNPCKALLVHCFYHNHSMTEISDLLDYKNSDTVKNMKYKCIQRLRKLFHSEIKSTKLSRA